MKVPLFGTAVRGKSPNVNAQRRLNCFLEFSKEPDKTPVTVYGTPGLSLFVDFGDEPVRGMLSVGNLLYIVHRGTLWEVNQAGTKTSRGTLDTTVGKVSMADNGLKVMIVDGTSGYVYTISGTSFAKITDVDFPATPATCAWQDGFFMVHSQGAQKFFVSAVNDPAAWDALDFASAESQPDNIQHLVSDRSIVHLLGETSIELWANSGATDFPFTRIEGVSVEWGLAARWSIQKYDSALIGVFRNRMGDAIVGRLAGYQMTRVSDQDLETRINAFSTVDDAAGFAYFDRGHPFYQVNFPTAEASWLYDGLTQSWSELESTGVTRHRAELGALFLGKKYVSDFANGKVYRLDATNFTDAGAPIAFEVITRHFFDEDNQVSIDRLWVDAETGVGVVSGQGADPMMMLAISKDGGHTWGDERLTTLGAIGKYRSRAQYRRLGRGRDWLFKLRITDPVKRALVSGYLDVRGAAH